MLAISAKATETAFKNFIASSLWIYQIDRKPYLFVVRKYLAFAIGLFDSYGSLVPIQDILETAIKIVAGISLWYDSICSVFIRIQARRIGCTIPLQKLIG